LLLLDEPFGAGCSNPGGLQEQLMKIAQENQLTCIMVTHVDEALLSDRMLLTNGPESYIGQILDVPRPRDRMEVVNHPNYYSLRMRLFISTKQNELRSKGKASSSNCS